MSQTSSSLGWQFRALIWFGQVCIAAAVLYVVVGHPLAVRGSSPELAIAVATAVVASVLLFRQLNALVDEKLADQ